MSAHHFFSVRRVMALAGNTFRELVRQKVFYFLVLFALLLIRELVAEQLLVTDLVLHRHLLLRSLEIMLITGLYIIKMPEHRVTAHLF